MNRATTFGLFYLAVLLQAGAYGLTFMLPKLFEAFGADEKMVGAMLFVTALTTIITVYFAGHLTDKFGRVKMLSIGCGTIAVALASYGFASGIGALVVAASVMLGFGWGLTYSLAPIVLTTLVSESERIRGFTLLSVAVMAGFGLSPVLASVLENVGFSLNSAFYVTAALCAASTMVFFALVGPVQRHAFQGDGNDRSSLSWVTVRHILTSPSRLPLAMVCIGASVFAGVNNFQTVLAEERALNYADFFVVYTITVIIFRLLLARFKGGQNPYLTIALLQYVMFASIMLFFVIFDNAILYWAVAFLFGIGYGVSYPLLVSMAARDADTDLLAQTLQLFALTYFIGIFCFPLLAGWIIVELGTSALLMLVATLAAIEATMALVRSQTQSPDKVGG